MLGAARPRLSPARDVGVTSELQEGPDLEWVGTRPLCLWLEGCGGEPCRTPDPAKGALDPRRDYEFGPGRCDPGVPWVLFSRVAKLRL